MNNIDSLKMHEQHRFTIKGGKMKHDVIEKSKFVQINDKIFYFFLEDGKQRFAKKIKDYRCSEIF